ncbi:tRNA(Ile)-lysidine synthetase, partial [hydrothermal vent metagenome]
MGTPEINLDAVRRDRMTRGVVARWRALTGGQPADDHDRRTLVACSGGADSVALVLMLAAGGGVGSEIVVGHVLHDLRSADETAADRDLVAGLAARLGLRFVEAPVTVRDQPGNAEGNAREARYHQLERLAWETGCPFVATAHHANDQVETMLMAMLRGAGVGGMAGMEPRRGLGERGIALVRPMLEIGGAE